MKKRWLTNKTFIITGAASGIGAGITEKLIEKYNCKIIGIIINDIGLNELLEKLGDKKDHFSYLYYDVSKQESWQEIVKYLDTNNIQVDGVINNAGIFPQFNRYENYTTKALEECMAVDFFSVAYSINELYPHIKKSTTPAFITISSSAALAPLPGTSLYTASKSASKSLTECFSAEHPEIYVACVCPGFTKTNLFSRQNEDMSKNKLISHFMTEREKMVKKIVRGIKRRRRLMSFGFDAKAMLILYKLFPRLSPKLFRWVMRKSKQTIFENIFK